MSEFTYLDVVTLETLKGAYQELLGKLYPDGVPDEEDPASVVDMLNDVDYLITKINKLVPKIEYVGPETVYDEPKGTEEIPF